MSGDFESYSSAQLAAQVRQGDAEAFAALSARFLWLVRAKAHKFSGAAAPEGEDLTQEGLLGLYAAAVSFEDGGGASFATYAGVCIYNRMASAVRRYGSSGNRTLNESVSLDSGEALITGGDADPGAAVEWQEWMAQLRQRLESALSPLERKVLALYLSGCPRREWPGKLGLPQKSCDNALHRVRSKLRALHV